MGRRLRRIEQHAIYETTQNVVDRQFLLKPDHYKWNRTLSRMSHPRALDMSNDHTPIPSTWNIIGAAIGRAMRAVPVNLHAFETNINHKHCEESVDAANCLGPQCPHHRQPSCGGVETHPARFHQRVNSVIAQQINKKYDREGPLWSAPERVTECTNDQRAEQKLQYAMTNAVKDGLVDKVEKSPFFNTYAYWVHGEALRFWYIDWEAYERAGGERKKSHRPKDYLHWVEWEPKALPSWAEAPRHRYAEFIKRMCRDVEMDSARRRRREKRPAPRVSQMFEVDPRDRPKTPRKKRKQPLCHASSREEKREYKEKNREFVREHRAASLDYRRGDFYREFPKGSFRPPLISAYCASGL